MSMIASLVSGVLWAVQAASARPAEPQDPDRPALSLSELKGLRDNNIFSPPKPKRTEPSRREDKREDRRSGEPAAPPRPKPALLTGVIFDLKTGTHLAIFEDRNPAPKDSKDPDLRQFKEPKFLSAGAELAGYVIESVSPEKVVIKKGEAVKELKVGESLPDDGAPASAVPPSPSEGPAPAAKPEGAAEPKTETKPSGNVEDVKKRLKEQLKKNRSYDEP